MITFNRENSAKHVTDTIIRHSSNILLKAGIWQRQVFSRKDKYESNLMIFQNKEHLQGKRFSQKYYFSITTDFQYIFKVTQRKK